MSDQLIATHAAPTLANLKAGSLFTSRIEENENIYDTLRKLNRRFTKKGLRVIPLRITKNRVLVYLYRLESLKRELENQDIQTFLRQYGYNPYNDEEAILHLVERVKESSDFPHEIGIFLGYPLEDVCGFIENKEGSKLVGYWRVYGDVNQAKIKFDRYKKCTDIFINNLKQNISLEEMTIETGGY